MRLLAAARLAASGRARNASTARTRCAKSSGRAGCFASTALKTSAGIERSANQARSRSIMTGAPPLRRRASERRSGRLSGRGGPPAPCLRVLRRLVRRRVPRPQPRFPLRCLALWKPVPRSHRCQVRCPVPCHRVLRWLVRRRVLRPPPRFPLRCLALWKPVPRSHRCQVRCPVPCHRVLSGPSPA